MPHSRYTGKRYLFIYLSDAVQAAVFFYFVRAFFQMNENKISESKGLLALSPLAVFLGVYLISSLAVGDFYAIPVCSAFLIASVYSLFVLKGRTVAERTKMFSSGAGDPNVLKMIWIFILAGAFAALAKSIGSVDATVALTLAILPGKLIFAGLFVAACFISMSIGTSVGTIVALMPLASGLASGTGVDLAFAAGIVVGGAFFGDNLSFISDTTIAATSSQRCAMNEKFKANILIVAPAALIVTAIYVYKGLSMEFDAPVSDISFLKIIPYLLVIVMALSGIDVNVVLTVAIVFCSVIGLSTGELDWASLMGSMGEGISGMSELIIATLLAGGLLAVIREAGGLDFIIGLLTRSIRGSRGAEFSIAGLVAFANLCTANNTIAIISVGDISRDIASRFGVPARRAASLLDTFSCLVQGLIPYGAQLLMASGIAGVSALSIIPNLYYPFALGLSAILAIIIRK